MAVTLYDAEAHRLATLYIAPAHVKEASVDALRPTAKLPAMMYGDPVKDRFPLHTKSAVWLSAAEFFEKRSDYKKTDAELIEKRIYHGARVHGTEHELLELEARIKKAATLDELPDAAFAVSWVNADGSKERYFRMINAAETVKAAAYLQEHRDMFPYPVRQEIAGKILEKAAEHAASLGSATDFIHRAAGFGLGPTSRVVDAMRDRVNMSRNGPGGLGDLQREFTDLANDLEAKPGLLYQPGMRVKAAAAIDEYDRRCNLLGMVRDGFLESAEEACFPLIREKMAALQQSLCETATGSVYQVADLEDVKLSAIREVFGPGLTQKLTTDGYHLDLHKAASVVPSLHRADARLLDNLLAEQGVLPAAKTSASDARELSREYLQMLRSDHLPGCW